MPPRARSSRTAASAGPHSRPKGRSKTRPATLTDDDVTMLRERLAEGKKPRVTLLVDTALGAAGTSAPIVSFGDPAEGEFISVRLKDDVVPFSPAELSMPTRGRKPAPAPASAAEPSGPNRAPAGGAASRPAPAPPALPLEPPATPEPARPARLVAVPDEPPAPAAVAPAAPPAEAAAGKPPAKAARRPAKSGNLSITLRFVGQNWTYESSRGGRRTGARPVSLGAVRAFADRLDDPPLRRDILAAIDQCRERARSRAEQLRAELERVEDELAELDE